MKLIFGNFCFPIGVCANSVRPKMNWVKIIVQPSHYACNVSVATRIPGRLSDQICLSCFVSDFEICNFFFRTDAPRCKPGTEQSSVGSINMHSIDVRCEVDADPAENIRFSWTYNNTRNVSPVRPNAMHANCRCVFFFFCAVHLIDLFVSGFVCLMRLDRC